ncbi:oleate hydratase [Sphingomonas psychrolutea]|uniref:Oleate hydratase n=1 Tax=Sphingomonas psychrolutea TaxID=1259676 RepID=A0ABQ1H8A3_9SPHN|nr:oleate hydratase [Sphingomonas psychrolutea]GGA60336.1 oleate hydratase [Sphingomonas psychrolutea]
MSVDPNASDQADDFGPVPRHEGKVYLVGGGIASLAAAAFLIRDGDVRGSDITIFDEGAAVGGSLDATGFPDKGYVLRGGRMLESKYVCTFDLFASIPTLAAEKTVTQEIFDWNATIETSSKARLFADGHRQVAPEFGLAERHILTIERLAIEPEAMLGRSTIGDQFDTSFFATNFWLMWCTTFAFQPWHSAVEFKRYLVRFAHMVDGFNRLNGIMRTRYNQYDSMVRPLQKWLGDHGVRFQLTSCVTDIHLHERDGETTARSIDVKHDGAVSTVSLAEDDYVFVTLGSMTEGSDAGSMDQAPRLHDKRKGGAWMLWERIARDRPAFGRPSVFSDHVDQSKWISFTTTLHDPAFLDLVRDATGNMPGEGGLITFPKSAWLASIVIPYQPHFIGQPEDVAVFWGYGLTVDVPGDYVKKPMSACSGREIMTEILGHLGILTEADKILGSATCIPSMMPFITSQFLPRAAGDRPQVVPSGSTNLAFMGQFCELPDDVVFTVEYSIRSAQTAVYELLGLRKKAPPVYKGTFDPRILYRAFIALHDGKSAAVPAALHPA